MTAALSATPDLCCVEGCEEPGEHSRAITTTLMPSTPAERAVALYFCEPHWQWLKSHGLGGVSIDLLTGIARLPSAS